MVSAIKVIDKASVVNDAGVGEGKGDLKHVLSMSGECGKGDRWECMSSRAN